MHQELNQRWTDIFYFRWNPSSTNPRSAKGDIFSEGCLWWSCWFAGLIAFPCRRECLAHAEVLRSLGRLVNCSKGAAAHDPPDPEMVDNCSGWVQSDLIITGYWSKMPMMRMVPGFRSKTEIWRPSEWLGLSGWKPLTAAHVPLQPHLPLQQSLSYTR